MTQHIEEARKMDLAGRQWAVFENGNQKTSWTPSGYGDEAGWAEVAKRYDFFTVEYRDLVLLSNVQSVIAAAEERGRKEERAKTESDQGYIEDMLAASPHATAWEEVKAYVEWLERSNEIWRRNSIDTHAAMVAMRNDINQHVPIASIESDLLHGPESSVFCAAVASAVAARIAELEARLKEAER